jgi:hypothetical protein
LTLLLLLLTPLPLYPRPFLLLPFSLLLGTFTLHLFHIPISVADFPKQIWVIAEGSKAHLHQFTTGHLGGLFARKF